MKRLSWKLSTRLLMAILSTACVIGLAALVLPRFQLGKNISLTATTGPVKVVGEQSPEPDRPKPSTVSAATPQPSPSSCPISFGQEGIVTAADEAQVPAALALETNMALAVGSDGWQYAIYGGVQSPDDWSQPGESNTDPGVIIVIKRSADPCKVKNPSDMGPLIYRAPTVGGEITLTSVANDTVFYRNASGHSGSFNFVLHTYS